MRPTFTVSHESASFRGQAVAGAEDRQRLIPGFSQERFSRARVLCVGAGGIISMIAPTLARKGIGGITLLDDDVVEPSNLNRQRFYLKDVGRNKAVALAENLVGECIRETELKGHPFRFQEALARGLDLDYGVVICGVDNNPARVAVSRYFRGRVTPVVFTAVNLTGDHGYVFVQDWAGPCLACLFPDIVNDDRHPCPGTPAIADILQAVGALASYAVDTLITERPRNWNYRRLSLADGSLDGSNPIPPRPDCKICSLEITQRSV